MDFDELVFLWRLARWLAYASTLFRRRSIQVYLKKGIEASRGNSWLYWRT